MYSAVNPVNQYNLPISIPVSGQGVRATPTLTWATPAQITYPTKLSATQLNAKATVSGTAVPGTFVYSPALGTLLIAGSHTLNVAFTPTNLTDYAPVSGSVTLVVNKAALSVIGDSATRTYGAANPAFTYTFDGFVNGDTAATATHGKPTVSSTADKGYPWGDYDINVTVGTLTSINYSFFFVPGTLFIDKAQLKVIAGNATAVVDTPIPTFTYAVTGFVNGETKTVLTGTPAETTTAQRGSPVGMYPIDITQGTLAAENYNFTFVDGTLTIKPLGPAAKPVFTHREVEGSSALKVALTDATRDATIYYTTDGKTPSTSSTRYRDAIEVTKTETIKAIAAAKGYRESPVASATYTVK
jgi:hypothetical protein